MEIDLEHQRQERQRYARNLAFAKNLGIPNLRQLYKDVSDCGTPKQFEAFNQLLELVATLRDRQVR